MNSNHQKELIVNYGKITNIIISIKSLRESYLTNFYFGEDYCNMCINNKLFFVIEYEKCIFILKKDHDFYHLYFFASSKNSLEASLKELLLQYTNYIFIADIIGMETLVSELCSFYEQNDFIKYRKLFRMSRTKNLDEQQLLDERVKTATMKNAEQIKLLFEKYFDPYSEQIPLTDEIKKWIETKNIFIIVEKNNVIGFVIFEIIGMTSYLRYWFTHPEYRDKKIGSALLRRFFHECRATKRQLFWVISSNENAIIRYKHYGFEQEQLIDQIMIRKNNHEK